jgi:phytoene/squalene synthetase
LRQPLDNADLESAQRICAEICRLALQDFAPALLLLPTGERQRVQALTAYTLTLFDFVRQTGLEGERLSAINRWEFELESALDGRGRGQPVFVLLHHLEQQRPWPREAFDRLHTYARRRCALPRPVDAHTSQQNAVVLGEALTSLTTGAPVSQPIVETASSVIRLHGLMTLGNDLRRHRPQLPVTELPESIESTDWSQSGVLRAAIEGECRLVREQLGTLQSLRALPVSLQPAARYCWLATHRILARIEDLGPRLVETAPRLSLLTRVSLLLRSRWR